VYLSADRRQTGRGEARYSSQLQGEAQEEEVSQGVKKVYEG